MTILKKIAETENYQFDQENQTIYGKEHGISYAVKMTANNVYIMYLSVKNQLDPSRLVDNKEMKQYLTKTSAINVLNYKLSITIKSGLTRNRLKENIKTTINEVTRYLNENSFVDCCELTGEVENVHLYTIGYTLSFLSETAYAQQLQRMDANAQENADKKESVILGIVGALLGSVIGLLTIVIISQLGYYAIIGGIVMGICTLKGYELLGKKLSKKGVVISLVIILFMTFISHLVDYSISVARYYEVNFVDVFPQILNLVNEGYIDETIFANNLVLLLLFTIIGAVATIISEFKNRRVSNKSKLLM